MGRKSKDKIIGNRGRNTHTVELIKEVGGYVLNGTMKEDKEGEFMYTETRESSVIDYIIVNEYDLDRMEKFRVEGRVDSDHLLVTTRIHGEERSKEEEEEEKERKSRIRIRCVIKAKQKYMEETDEIDRDTNMISA